MAAASALSDRINIARNRTWPDILLSTQYFINCKLGGTCNGGVLQVFIIMQIFLLVFHKLHANNMLLKILQKQLAQIFKNAWIVVLLIKLHSLH